MIRFQPCVSVYAGVSHQYASGRPTSESDTFTSCAAGL
ncbi:MAG: hypothetical protein BWY59_00806 [Verrucomicrobia bacterium ADurb.Bin345]|nr:MAG: hypothetical protein BWY59_00806 [Verrucomicrobia bacterium ADurb.Bin345]